MNAHQRAVADIERCLAHWREMRGYMAENEPTDRAARRRWERKYGAPWAEMHREAVEAVEMFETGLTRIEAAT